MIEYWEREPDGITFICPRCSQERHWSRNQEMGICSKCGFKTIKSELTMISKFKKLCKEVLLND